MARMKTAPKLILIFLLFGALVGGFIFLKNSGTLDKMAPVAKADRPVNTSTSPTIPSSSPSIPTNADVPLIRVGVVTWGGYAGGQYFNRGFNPNNDSRFLKEYGINVKFMVMDDFAASREAWKSDNVDLMWITADSFPTEVANLAAYDPKIVFQADWSRGGDAIVAMPGINSINDLRGKKIAVAPATPSQTFLMNALETAGIGYGELEIIKAPSAVEAAGYFKARQVDAAVVWSPDDEDCISNVPGATILTSTKEGTHIIADVFYAKSSWIQNNKSSLKSLIEGWMKGSAEINSSDTAKRAAAKILAAGLQQPEDFCYKAINNVRLTTYGDNVNTFNLRGGFRGIKLEELYTKNARRFAIIGEAPANVPMWRNVVDTSILRDINLSGMGHQAEVTQAFTAPTMADVKAKPLSTKPVNISFPSGQYSLDSNSMRIIDMQFVDVAKAFPQSRIRIEGNTDSVGEYNMNMSLSKKRAQAVANYLSQTHGFDANRFVIVGNGPDKPVAGNDDSAGRAKNRRTDFMLL